MCELTHFSLCTGIGGIDLAAEWAGFKTIAQCEINDYASKILEKNFKGVYNFHDIRTITNGRIESRGIKSGAVTVLSAGFPCQPYSLAGKGLGDDDSRDLWEEVARVIGLVCPTWFVGENTQGLFARENQRYLQRIISDLEQLGYNVAWGIWGACDVGAAHQRKRVFIVAYSDSKRWRSVEKNKQKRCAGRNLEIRKFSAVWEMFSQQEINTLLRMAESLPEPSCGQKRNDDGLSSGVDRIKCLGNAVVPQQIYPIFQFIAEFERLKEKQNKYT